MPRIPFDDRVITPRLQAAPQRRQNGEAQAITNRANARLGKTVMNAAQTGIDIYQQSEAADKQRLKEQDESDMVATRAAYLRLQKEESAELQKASSGEDIKKTNSEFKKRYEAISSGKDSRGRPRFRNESGSNQFKEQFTDKFHLKRGLSAADQTTKLDRRNTNAKFFNGIKSVSESDYYDKPRAGAEIKDYVQKQVDYGFYTDEEGKEKLDIHLKNLDIERAGRKLVGINAEPMKDFDGATENPIEAEVKQYKEYVNSLGNLSDVQKKSFTQKADSLLKNAKQATKAAEKERGIQIEKQQNDYQTQAMIDVEEGKRPLSSIYHDPKISYKYKEKHLPKLAAKTARYKKIIADEGKSFEASKKAFETKYWNGIVNSKLANKANTYDAVRHDDASGSVAVALKAEIYGADDMPSQTKTMLVGLIQNSSKVPPHIKAKKDNHIKDMERIFGLTKESFDVFSTIESTRLEAEGIFSNDYFMKSYVDPKTGERMVDGLNEFERRDALNTGIMEYNSLMNQGKEKEAEEYIIKYKSDYELSENDTELYSGYFKEVNK